MYLAATQYILGIRPEYAGLVIDPQAPNDWQEFKVTRICRGVVCNIEVSRTKNAEKGLYVDGKKVEGNIVPWDLFKSADSLDIELKI